MRRGIACVEGSRIASATFPRRQDLRPLTVEPTPARVSRRLRGRTIDAVQRLGKRVVLALGDLRLVIEPRMTGLLLLADPPTDRHVRARLRLEGGSAAELLFWDRRGIGVISLLTAAEMGERLGAERLGPDALGIGAARLRERLGRSRRAIKVGLLDQRALAGVGNIYASEALHAARIHPARPCKELQPAHWRRLADALERVLREAIRYEGSDLGDGTYRSALDRKGSNYQVHHRVYGREGEPCRRCGATVERVVMGQRATFFCGECQR